MLEKVRKRVRKKVRKRVRKKVRKKSAFKSALIKHLYLLIVFGFNLEKCLRM